ncbi:Universal stress protein A-like protein [Linum grandiflorum]
METATAGAMMMSTEQQQQRRVVRPLKVMVAIDESDCSFYALQWVLDHLVGSRGGIVPSNEPSMEETGMVTLVHVQQPFHAQILPVGPGGGGAAAFYATSATFQQSMKAAAAENSAALLARALKLCSDKMIKAETLVLEGDAKDKLCQATEQTHVDLLVVGSRGLGKIKRAFLGSVSDFCAHHAKCPVLIVKPNSADHHTTSATSGGGARH